MLGALSRSPRWGALRSTARSASIRSFTKHRGTEEADYALVLYAWQRPLNWFESMISTDGAPTDFYVRAIGRDAQATDVVRTGTACLNLPPALQHEPYRQGKIEPGVLARFSIPGHGSVAYNYIWSQEGAGNLVMGYKETEFIGVVLGWNDRDFIVNVLDSHEYKVYDTSVPASQKDLRGQTFRIPRSCMIDVGQSEIHAFPGFSFGVYAALSVPTAYSSIRVMWGDMQLEVARQVNLFPDHVFQARHGAPTTDAMRSAGLVQSHVSLRVDDVAVPVLVPENQVH